MRNAIDALDVTPAESPDVADAESCETSKDKCHLVFLGYDGSGQIFLSLHELLQFIDGQKNAGRLRCRKEFLPGQLIKWVLFDELLFDCGIEYGN